MNNVSSDKLFEMFQEDHKELSEQIDDLKRFWNEVNELGQGPKYEEMGSRVHEFRDQLAQHFSKEIQGGYLSPVLEQAPQFTEQANSLKQQHAQMLISLDQYIDRLQKCGSDFHCWQEVRTDFDEFIRCLHEHEKAETEIVEKAVHNMTSTPK